MAVKFSVTRQQLEFWNSDRDDISKLISKIYKKIKNDFGFSIVILNNSEIPTTTNYTGFYMTIKGDIIGAAKHYWLVE